MFRILSLWLVCQPLAAYKVAVATENAKAKDALFVADLAFEQKAISHGVYQGMKNATLLMEAARSAGLLWDKADAQRHIEKVVDELNAQLFTVEAARHTGWGKGLSMGKMADSVGSFGCGSKSQCDDDTEDTAEVVGSSISATLDLIFKFADGSLTWQDALGTIGGIALGVVGLINPVLGQVFTVAFSFFTGLLGMGQESSEVKLYKKIMKETQIMIQTSFAQEEIGARATDMQVLVEEMRWAPVMLGQVKNDEDKHTLLMYYVMIQHDIAKISSKILTSNFGKSESDTPPEMDKVRADWSKAMVPIAFYMMQMQVNLILDINHYVEVEGRVVARNHTTGLLERYKGFFEQHFPKIERSTKLDIEDQLDWKTPGCEEARSGKTEFYRRSTGKSCTVNGVDACEEEQCSLNFKSCPAIPCTSYHMNRYLEKQLNAIQKQRALAAELYDKKPKEGISFKMLEKGAYCRDGYIHGTYNQEGTFADLETCAKQCESEDSCYFFAFANGLTCSRYSIQNDGCTHRHSHSAHTVYAKIHTPFKHLGRGYCARGYFDAIRGSVTYDSCTKACESDNRCWFFAYDAGQSCAMYDSRADDCLQKTDDPAYVSFEKTAKVWKCENSPGVEIGDHFIQFGSWRLAHMDDAHLSISHRGGQTSMIWRWDQTLHAGPRTTWGSWQRASGVKLVGLDMDTSQQKVAFGNRFVEIGRWRFGDSGDGEHFSISQNQPGRSMTVVQSFDQNGQQKTQQKGGEYWKLRTGIAKGLGVGDGFIQLGSFRMGEADPDTFVVSHMSGKDLAVYTSDGRHCYGPDCRSTPAVSLWSRPICLDSD